MAKCSCPDAEFASRDNRHDTLDIFLPEIEGLDDAFKFVLSEIEGSDDALKIVLSKLRDQMMP